MRSLPILLMLFGSLAHAGFIELGASANYRASGYDDNNYIQSLTYTGSISYYFWEMCAWEATYTTGYSKQVSKGTGDLDPKQMVEDNIDMVNLDLVLSLTHRDAVIRPYIKFGGGYLMKDRYLKINDDDKNLISHEEGLVPSGGVGLAIGLTKDFNIKVGIEAWSSPPKDKSIIDYAGRAGVSLVF